jgi:hypothetical protein
VLSVEPPNVYVGCGLDDGDVLGLEVGGELGVELAAVSYRQKM